MRKVKAFSGIRGKLESAMESGEPVTIDVQSGFPSGVNTPDGKVFAPTGHNIVLDIFSTVFVLLVSLLLTPFIVGIPFLLWGAWYFWGVWSFRFAAWGLPDAITI